MAEKQINPILKQVLELGPTIVFFLIYLRIKENTYTFGGTDYSGFIVATLVFVPILLVSMAVLWKLSGKLSRMQVFTAFMVIFFGGLTAYFNDERFFKMKTTIVYGVFAAILGIGLLRRQSYLRYIMEDFLPMEKEGWMILTAPIGCNVWGDGARKRIHLAHANHRALGQAGNLCLSGGSVPVSLVADRAFAEISD